MRKPYYAVAANIVFCGVAIGQTAAPPQRHGYDPTQFGIPRSLGGYPVLAVLDDRNSPCMRPGQRRLVIQSSQLTAESGPRDFPKQRIQQELQALNLGEYTKAEFTVIGPGESRERLLMRLEKYRSECPHLALPSVTSNTTTGGEDKKASPYAGYAIIQDTEIEKIPDNNGQSVILVAPPVPYNQQLVPIQLPHCDLAQKPLCTFNAAYSAFLNNGLTDTNYFLQVGFWFFNGRGMVVYASSARFARKTFRPRCSLCSRA